MDQLNGSGWNRKMYEKRGVPVVFYSYTNKLFFSLAEDSLRAGASAVSNWAFPYEGAGLFVCGRSLTSPHAPRRLGWVFRKDSNFLWCQRKGNPLFTRFISCLCHVLCHLHAFQTIDNMKILNRWPTFGTYSLICFLKFHEPSCIGMARILIQWTYCPLSWSVI